ncbi:MAG: aldolase/citrate lyase family protein [Betaproteobacteria bacterium]|jgi:citrate lyase subunit beta/citryl-CoA lyase|nr:CoA ester lyase [Betaproteobacteria bacterium]NBY06648.1 CoA ester lyase [Betaproteobacteria bacterium]
MNQPHPRDVLRDAQGGGIRIPVCDHYSGVEQRMKKSLQLQHEMTQEFGTCVFDVTLDCEDGAPVGGEIEHAHLVTELALAASPDARVAVRVHPVDHPVFQSDIAHIVAKAGHRLCHIMVPKVESLQDVQMGVDAIDQQGAKHLPIHVLIESPAAVHRAFDIASHPRVQSMSFGLMDFVSTHGGAISSDGMGIQGQFTHPLVMRAKIEISSACHAHGKVPAHGVVTEFNDIQALQNAAHTAAHQLAFTRMWSIHPSQIRPILQAMAPSVSEIEKAARILLEAEKAQWAPIRFDSQLHDRASYRFFWHVLERAHLTGAALPSDVHRYFE